MPTKKIILSIDVEDWFQVENLKDCIAYSSWDSQIFRVEYNTHRILDLLDYYKRAKTENHLETNRFSATFFILGWIAKRLPQLVREIQSRGHEVASHGYSHKLAINLTENQFRNDLVRSKKLLEDITGSSVIGYRAPSFSINAEILKIIYECGFRYDSSYNSFSMNHKYGKIDLSKKPRSGIAYQIFYKFYELPITNLEITRNKVLPLGGGGYFRLLPFNLFKCGTNCMLKKNGTFLFYLHPWEIDPFTPRFGAVSFSKKFRHCVNLKETFSKFSFFIESLIDHDFISCRGYIDQKLPDIC